MGELITLILGLLAGVLGLAFLKGKVAKRKDLSKVKERKAERDQQSQEKEKEIEKHIEKVGEEADSLSRDDLARRINSLLKDE